MDEARKRLPRQRRVPIEERPPMALTDRDREVVKGVNDHRVLLTEQIQALYFGSRSTTQSRLARLYQHEYLERHFPTIYGDAPASTQAIYTIGKRGAQLLVDTYGYDRSDLRLPKRSSFSWIFLEHVLKVNDVRVAIALAARLNGWQLAEWRDETFFRAKPDYVNLTDKRGTKRKLPVLPDGYFMLVTPHGKARFFLEVDRGTEALSKFTPQVAVYEAFVGSGQYQERFQAKSLRILVVTTSQKRLDSLMRATADMAGDRKYCFTTFDRLTKETALTAAIWRRVGDTALSPLFETNASGG